jgi:hypothetical protein
MSEIKKPAKTALPKKPTTTKVVKSPKVEAPQQVSNHVHYANAAQMQPNNVASGPQTVIVQNILKGPLFISDIGMEFGALEAKDLTYEDPSLVKRSQDLRKALQLGHLVRISQEELDNILAMRIAEARAETQRIGGGQRTRDVKVDGRIVQAEVLNLNKAAAGRAERDQINTAGYENDPMSYASAFQEARLQYEDRGAMLDANTFSSMVKNKPSLIQSLLRGDSIFNDGVISGVSTHARATVITKGDGYNTGVAQMNMTNYNRDQRIAGADQMGVTGYQNRDGYLNPNSDQMPAHHIPDLADLDNLDDDDDDDSGYAEEIDLSSEIGSSNGIRKLS